MKHPSGKRVLTVTDLADSKMLRSFGFIPCMSSAVNALMWHLEAEQILGLIVYEVAVSEQSHWVTLMLNISDLFFPLSSHKKLKLLP